MPDVVSWNIEDAKRVRRGNLLLHDVYVSVDVGVEMAPRRLLADDLEGSESARVCDFVSG